MIYHDNTDKSLKGVLVNENEIFPEFPLNIVLWYNNDKQTLV